MDLGFGKSNQVVGDAVAQALADQVKAQENLIDEQLDQYNKLLNDNDSDDDAALEQIRKRRIAQLKQAQTNRQAWLAAGHGAYSELHDTRDFFNAAKSSHRLIVHFYRPTTRLCDYFHAGLEKLAAMHLESRFVKINVETDNDTSNNGTAFLVEKLKIVVMPTIVIVINREAVHHIRGFDELGGATEFTPQQLAHVLGRHNGIDCTPEEAEAVPVPYQGVNAVNLKKASKSNNILSSSTRSTRYTKDDEFE